MILRDSTAMTLSLLGESGLALTPSNIAKNTRIRPPTARKRCETLLNAEYVEVEETWDRTFYRINKLGRARLLMQQQEIALHEVMGPDEQVRFVLAVLEAVEDAEEPSTVSELAAELDAERSHVSALIDQLLDTRLVEEREDDDTSRYTVTTKARRLLLAYD